MSDRCIEILTDSCLSWKYIPSGRQLPRTPLTGVKKHLDFCSEETSEDHEPQQNMEAEAIDEEDNNQNMMFEFNTNGPETAPDDPNSMLKGMKGYQLTPIDREFIEKMKMEKIIKKLQRDQEEVQRKLKKEMMLLELALASWEKMQADLKMLPSCKDLLEWVTVVFRTTSPSTQLTDLDLPSLLDMVTKENIQRVAAEKRIELTRLDNMVANKRKKVAHERRQLEKQIDSEQLKIQGLKSQLTNLKCEFAQQEEVYKALQMQINSEEADSSKELRAKGREKEGTKAAKFTEKFQGATNESISTKGKTDSQTSVKYDHAIKNTPETLTTNQKPAKSVKEAGGPQKKVEEQEANSQESVPAARGRKPPATTAAAASRPKKQSAAKSGEASSTSGQAAPSRGRKRAAAGDAESQNVVLRRSKRIASRR